MQKNERYCTIATLMPTLSATWGVNIYSVYLSIGFSCGEGINKASNRFNMKSFAMRTGLKTYFYLMKLFFYVSLWNNKNRFAKENNKRYIRTKWPESVYFSSAETFFFFNSFFFFHHVTHNNFYDDIDVGSRQNCFMNIYEEPEL